MTPRPSNTDSGNATRFVEQHGDIVRYVSDWKVWLIWDGFRWRPDRLGGIVELAKVTARSIYAEASLAVDDDERKAIVGWARASESEDRLRKMVKLAQSIAGVPILSTDLDQDVWLLGCTNGTVDLRTGKLKDADPADLITKSTGIDFDPGATCPRWEAFISWAMADRPALVQYVQRSLGYSLSGDVSERVAYVLWGTGRNGKSTLLQTMRHVVGEYGMRAPISTLAKKDGKSASNDVARLQNVRFVTMSETDEGMKLGVATLKDLVGNETVVARMLYSEFIEFMPQFKPWLGTNYKPDVPADDQAIWDRLKLIPFDARISDAELDRDLGDKLKAEAPGILAWCVRGLLDMRDGGLRDPEEVKSATKEYRDEVDSFTDFLDYLTLLDTTEYPASRVLSDYHSRNLTETRMDARKLKAEMLRHGWEWKKTNKGAVFTAPPVDLEALITAVREATV